MNFEDAVAEHRIGRGVQFDVVLGIVGGREHVPRIPRHGRVGRGTVGQQRKAGFLQAVGVLPDDVPGHHFVRFGAGMEHLALWNLDGQVHRLHGVGDLKRGQDQLARFR